MPRKERPLLRETGVLRDATLVVIASEDTHAVRLYFDRFAPKRVQYEILSTENGQSSPAHILERLNNYQNEYQLNDEDQLWYCGDTDHWVKPSHIHNLTDVLTVCRQKNYGIALSNPCFELWLLLHFQDPPPPEEMTDCKQVIALLREVAGGYTKDKGCVASINADMIDAAIRRAKKLDTGEAIPPGPATTIYRLLEELANRRRIALK